MTPNKVLIIGIDGTMPSAVAERTRRTLDAIEIVRKKFETAYKKLQDDIMNIAPDDDTTPFLERVSTTEEELLRELSRLT